jgi:hypothetical protein
MDASVSTSIADLYKVASNPVRTNVENMHKDEAPFVSSQNNSQHGEPPCLFDDDNASVHSRTSSRSSHSHKSETPSEKFRSETKTYISNRSSKASRRAQNIQNNPFVQKERERQKTVYLHELNRMKLGGSALSREYSNHDNVADIEFECNRIKANEDQNSTVSFMKDAIKLGATGLELLNNKFDILRINGWSGEVTRDMERYNRPLSKIYQRYWRRGSVSPFVELAFLLFGSLIVHHFKNVLTGGTQTASRQPARPPTVAPPSRNVPFHIPQSSNTTAPANPSSQEPKRRTMRRPKRGTQPPPSRETSDNQARGMPENLISMLLPQQQAPVFAQDAPVPKSVVGIGVVSGSPPPGIFNMPAPVNMFNMGGDAGVVVLDMSSARRRQRKNTTELEIIEETPMETRIDIQEDTNTTLSFDMA